MNFQPELAAKVVRGEKTVTRRQVSLNPRSPWWVERCGYQPGGGPGGSYAVCQGRGKGPAVGRIVVLDVRRERLGALDHAEAHAEGFDSPVAFALAWARINGSCSADTLVWRVEFAVL